MPDSRRTWAALAALYADNTAGAISPQDLRDGFASVKPHVASDAPTASDDETLGFDVGHAWIDTSTNPRSVYECVDPTTAAAVWVKRYPQDAGGGVDAGDVAYDNAGSGLSGDNVQAAIDELAGGLGVVAGVAGTALQPGDALTALAATGVPAGHVPKADGAGNIAWAAESGGGGGIAPSEGLVVVQHGDDPDVARPTAATVYWMGSVAPDNRATGDLWLETDAFDGGS